MDPDTIKPGLDWQTYSQSIRVNLKWKMLFLGFVAVNVVMLENTVVLEGLAAVTTFYLNNKQLPVTKKKREKESERVREYFT